MKRTNWIAGLILLAAAALPSAALAGEAGFAPEELERFGGMWYLNTVTQEGQTLSAADLEMEFTLQLNEDGSAFITTPGEEQNGTWAIDGDNVIISVPGTDDVPFTEEEGSLSASDDGVFLSFGREMAQPGYTPGEPAADVTEQDLNGTWECFRLSYYGMNVPIEMMADSMESSFGLTSLGLEIKGTDVRLTGTEQTLPYEMKDGVLTSETSPITALTLLDDGVLAADLYGAVLYYQKTSDESTLPEAEEEEETVSAEAAEGKAEAVTEEAPGSETEAVEPETLTEEVTEKVTEAAEKVTEAALETAVKPETEITYACTRASAGGYEFDPSRLGGTYSVIFHADGTASLTLAGTVMEGAAWEAAGDTVTVSLYNADRLIFTPENGGFWLGLGDGQKLFFGK